jgi:probable HAF family extracellular repeat protein
MFKRIIVGHFRLGLSNLFLIAGSILLIFSKSAVAASASAYASYTVQAVPSLAGVVMTPTAINDLGQVVGQLNGTGGFYFNGTTTTSLPVAGYYEANAVGINDSSTICGFGTTQQGDAYVYTQQGSTVTNLGAINQYGTYAYGINNSGQIVGYGEDSTGRYDRAVLYSGGTFQNLGTLPGEAGSDGFALNNRGDVVGISANTNGAGFPFIYTAGAMHQIGSVNGRGLGINDSQQVVGLIAGGFGEAFYDNYATSFYSAVPAPVGFLGSILEGINDSGVAVGDCSTSSLVEGAVYIPGQTMVPFDQLLAPSASGWNISSSAAINNLGQVVGVGSFDGGSSQVVILTPVAVPEPSGLSFLAIGGLTLLRRRRS